MNPMRSTLKLKLAVALVAAGLCGAMPLAASAQAVSAETMREVSAKVDDSIVIVRFTYDSPGQRIEVEAHGIVVSDDGRVMVPLDFVDARFPDQYLTRFKIVLPPSGDEAEQELPAYFTGRDERSGVAFVQFGRKPAEEAEDNAEANAALRDARREVLRKIVLENLKPGIDPDSVHLQFASTQDQTGDGEAEMEEPEEEEDDPTEPLPEVDWSPMTFNFDDVEVGTPVLSVGRFTEDVGYTTFVTANRVSAKLRGALPTVMTAGDGLTAVGGVVVNESGEAIGYIPTQPQVSPMQAIMDAERGGMQMWNIAPPRLFVPASFLKISLDNPPMPGEPVKIAETGMRQLEGVSKDLREYYELGNKPAIQVGDVIPDSAAAAAGVATGDVIIAINGENLERGDQPEELPSIFERTLSRLTVGETVKLTLLDAAGEQKDVDLGLRERPTQSNAAHREYNETLGFTVRDLVFDDTYALKIDADSKGALVEYIQESSAAANARLGYGDLIRKINQTDVTDPKQFIAELDKFLEANPNEAVVLEVFRRGDTQIIRIEPPQ